MYGSLGQVLKMVFTFLYTHTYTDIFTSDALSLLAINFHLDQAEHPVKQL